MRGLTWMGHCNPDAKKSVELRILGLRWQDAGISAYFPFYITLSLTLTAVV